MVPHIQLLIVPFAQVPPEFTRYQSYKLKISAIPISSSPPPLSTEYITENFKDGLCSNIPPLPLATMEQKRKVIIDTVRDSLVNAMSVRIFKSYFRDTGLEPLSLAVIQGKLTDGELLRRLNPPPGRRDHSQNGMWFLAK
ncbi:hypothetical protein BLNAU_16643 [Blattamonas nauphoetae]|uniref:Uncharacterized protein n=1 Tax=Blattamonas nauphoetae TaxID=2049346 RepID=A0ABQ9X8B3_9EUKA|nr:hypothetical protein BLNAU_16643 [Blattamonas nauphoetae]